MWDPPIPIVQWIRDPLTGLKCPGIEIDRSPQSSS